MSDGIAEDTDDVVGMLTARIEETFGMSMDHLTAAVAAAPTAHPSATDVVAWHRVLVDSQAALNCAEDDLLAVLGMPPGEADDPAMDLAQRVTAAVTARDGRALFLRRLLDPDVPGMNNPAAEHAARLPQGARTGPAVPTSPPARPATSPAQTSVSQRGRNSL